MTGMNVVALGGGHGLAVTLRALRHLPHEITAIVGVGDDGGSSGRIREELDVVPPGDLRMALAALCGDDPWGQTWSRVMQHRFEGRGDLAGHSVGNLLIAALWEETGDLVAGLQWAGALLRTSGRVLPAAMEPVRLVATIDTEQGHSELRGQVSIATSMHPIIELRIEPTEPKPCPEAIEAIGAADLLVLGPGSWYTSVLPHLVMPTVRDAVRTTSARRVLVLNVSAQRGEASGYTPMLYLRTFLAHAPEITLDAIIIDEAERAELDDIREVMPDTYVHVSAVRDRSDPNRHNADGLATALREVTEVLAPHRRIAPWR